jgi:hypothetical protein
MPRPLPHFVSAMPGLLALAISLPLLALTAPTLDAQGTGAANQSVRPGPDAAAKAAARRRSFEQDEKRLEEYGSGQEVPEPDPQQTLFVSPALVGMLPGERQSFTVFDIDGHNLTPKARWTLSNPNVATLAPDGAPEIIARAPGTVTLIARVGGGEAESELKVYGGNSLPVGAIRWQAPKIPGYRTQRTVQAVPTANGPALYTTDTNGEGETLIRAFLSDGRQLWMGKLSGSVTSPNKGVP